MWDSLLRVSGLIFMLKGLKLTLKVTKDLKFSPDGNIWPLRKGLIPAPKGGSYSSVSPYMWALWRCWWRVEEAISHSFDIASFGRHKFWTDQLFSYDQNVIANSTRSIKRRRKTKTLKWIFLTWQYFYFQVRNQPRQPWIRIRAWILRLFRYYIGRSK